MTRVPAYRFPELSNPTAATWAPVLLSPVMGSPECFVIGVAAVSQNGFHLERANLLDQLQCLYGEKAATAIFAAEAALTELGDDLAKRGPSALLDPTIGFSGVSLGPLSEGQGNSHEQVAKAWMRSLSSLYKQDAALQLVSTSFNSAVLQDEVAAASGDPLPTLVMKYVAEQSPGLREFFNTQIQEGKKRRSHAHGVIVDFAGSHVVANFGTLQAGHRTSSVDRIKRRMFDLLVQRDAELHTLAKRSHAMLVQHPANDDPQFSDRQHEHVHEAIGALSEQAKQKEIAFIPRTSISDIGKYLVSTERARLAQA